MADDEILNQVRAQAAGWSTAITAALGVFSISGLVFAKGAISAAAGKDGRLWCFVAFAALGVLAALVAIGFSAVASYGWPKLGRKKHPNYGAAVTRQRERAIEAARHGMQISLWAAIGAIAFMAGAAGVAWWP
ncbi:MAG: hypothetical protein QM582_15430 [Micropruina sp.]|uniref:hypothetical protein n=1 Tax=Micropruina sp. TaxID=2737536 RepID=UPI0039E6BDA6